MDKAAETPGKSIIAHEIDGTKHTVPVADLQLRNSIYGVVIKDGHILLVPQWDGWDFPGGGIDMGETLKEALEREVQEETGMSVTADLTEALFVGEDFFIHPSTKKPYHCVLLYYRCTNPTGTISDAGFTEHEKEWAKTAQWVPLNKIETLKFYNPIDSLALIKKALQ
ncbi:MAG: NUDIX domain-containing protein [Bdellovibrionales bacterium]